jgi:REP element-mobilizing transposase RayT
VDHVHKYIAIPSKHEVSSVIGFFKGKSAIAVPFGSAKLFARRFKGKQRNFEGKNFWARGYAVSFCLPLRLCWKKGRRCLHPKPLFSHPRLDTLRY